MTSNVFDFVVPCSSEKTKWLAIYFVTALDCLSPVLEALYFMAWAEVKVLDNNHFVLGLLAHYSSLFRCVEMSQLFDPVFWTGKQILCFPIQRGNHCSFGIGFIGKLICNTGFNLSMAVENSRVVLTFFPEARTRPLFWHEHFLDNFIASEVSH